MLLQVMLPLVLPGVVTVAHLRLPRRLERVPRGADPADRPEIHAAGDDQVHASGQFGAIDWGAVQAGVTVMMVPCLILFLALQRTYLEGITSGSVK